MTDSIITQLLLPLSLAVIMFGMGLSLTGRDFLRLWQTPKPILLGMLGQLVLLPMVALAVCWLFALPPALAVGVMILSACPGGTTSNLISHLAKANLALSVSLTALSTLICVFTTPFIINLAVELFASEAATEFSLLTVALGLLAFSLLPILLGMAVRAKWRDWALTAEPLFNRFGVVFLLVLIVSVIIQEWTMLVAYFDRVFWATLALNLACAALGLGLGRLGGLNARDTLTLAIEIGMQNSTMAMLIAISLMGAPDYAIAAGIYSIAMYLGASALVAYSRSWGPLRRAPVGE
ncbi:bile acid:sodium symporter family protein [Ferrimonas balearica]|uniref:bile acid:sodium symporter family protein n=1 Tax=Ferrimonas balearica TaxID=44012 RepID=UPI001C995AF6|nr:bile acid:sodium symporter family protein [Ferrimonas balearica]MBY5992854.1 bile acid:sodium symporter family protein [Ferrimonas balearica]